MKKLFSVPVALFLMGAITLTSCKKDNPSSSSASSGDLDAGKSSISFSNSGSFAGSSSFAQANTATTTALSITSTLRNVSLRATEISGMNSKTVTINLMVAADASTSAGNLVGDFSSPASADIYPALTLSSTNGTSPGTSYVSKSGTITITKLTSSEIEGTFEAMVENDPVTESLSLTSGKFAGKF